MLKNQAVSSIQDPIQLMEYPNSEIMHLPYTVISNWTGNLSPASGNTAC